mmetsp:Transcript_41561/g.131013  ORF Transcript_41561/g.131013 Transcript_41561/m.131013 type:complete len:95 (-) Transcript_41561:466-750(-)
MRLSFYFSSPSSFVSPHLGPPPIASLSRRWKDHESAEPKYWVGMLSKKTRMIRIVNMLTKDEHTVEVCSEDILEQIQSKYLMHNKHAARLSCSI